MPADTMVAMTQRATVSTLWIVVMLNMVYADILSYLDANLLRQLMTGYAGGVRVTPALTVGAAVIGEVPILMVLLSRVLGPVANRWANLVAAALTAVYVIGGGSTSPHYLVLAAVELVCLALIVRYALRRPAPVGVG
jgi:Family of unknown function (DUF6326)